MILQPGRRFTCASSKWVYDSVITVRWELTCSIPGTLELLAIASDRTPLVVLLPNCVLSRAGKMPATRPPGARLQTSFPGIFLVFLSCFFRVSHPLCLFHSRDASGAALALRMVREHQAPEPIFLAFQSPESRVPLPKNFVWFHWW